MYRAIVTWNQENRMIKWQDFDTEQEGLDFLAELDDQKFPGAFLVPKPNSGIRYITVDPETKTITVDTSEEEAAQVKEDALTELTRLEELQTTRRMSEAMPDASGGSTAGRVWLKANRAAIDLEREKL